jgi:hypothetical protein
MAPTVTITDRGREGDVAYLDGSRAITGHQQLGGGDVVAIVSMGSVAEWCEHHNWAVERRAEILRFVANELIHQKAPNSSAEIDEVAGHIILREPARSAAPEPSAAADVSWVYRYRDLRGKFAVVLLAALLLVGAAVWFKTRVLVIDSPHGAPFGSTVRTDTHLATLISTLQPYTPSLHRDGSKDRFTLSVFLVPLDGSAPRLVPLVRDLPAGGYNLARVMGGDGTTMWVDANGLYGVNLRTYAPITADDASRASPGLDRTWFEDTRGMDIVGGRLQMLARDRSAAYALDPATLQAIAVTPQASVRQYSDPPLTHHMAAGFAVPPNAWIGLLSASDLAGAFSAGRWVRAVESASDTPRELRRLVRLDVEGDEGTHWQIRSIAPIGDTEYRNASFLRSSEQSEPLRVSDPDSVLMLYTSGDGVRAGSTLLIARVELQSGRLLWSTDTGLDRFKLEQILPGERRTAFVGTRPPVTNKVSEPQIVILDHGTGELAKHSLWQ